MTTNCVETQIALWTAIIAALTFIFTAWWKLKSFIKTNKTKAAEIFFNIEQSFSRHIPILLDIEDSHSYQQIVQAMQNKSKLTKKERKIFKRLDAMLRHFTTCSYIRNLNVDYHTVTESYIYYLNLFENRSELRQYIAKNYKAVDAWLKQHKSDSKK